MRTDLELRVVRGLRPSEGPLPPWRATPAAPTGAAHGNPGIEEPEGPEQALDALYTVVQRARVGARSDSDRPALPRVDDREDRRVHRGGALAFGRVGLGHGVGRGDVPPCWGPGRRASCAHSIRPATAIRCEALVHRWTRGNDFVALVWVLRQMIERTRIDRAGVCRRPRSRRRVDVGAAIERFSAAGPARSISRPAYGRRVPANPGVCYFFSRPSTGSACKRINLFLRWMIRHDGVDPGGWTAISPRQLIVPLDTHTIRMGRCLRLTRRKSPGWKMAAEITAALRQFDPVDPVRYDFALCHLSMMGACGWRTKAGSRQCPLRGFCRPLDGARGGPE